MKINKYKMKKIVREIISVNEDKITKSYSEPLSRDDIKRIIVKILMKFQKEGGRNITNMFNWLKINNFGDYQYNRWIKAIVDTLFYHSAGTWLPRNQNLSVDQLTDLVMKYWKSKFKEDK